MKTLKHLFSTDTSGPAAKEHEDVRKSIEGLYKFGNSVNKFVNQLQKLFADGAKIHRELGTAMDSFFDDECPQRPTVLYIVDTLKIFERVEAEMKSQVDAVKTANSDMVKRIHVVGEKLKARDSAYHQKDHYEKKLDKLRSQASPKGAERVFRNEQKLNAAVTLYNSQDQTSKSEIDGVLSTKYSDASMLVDRALSLSLKFLAHVGSQMEKLQPHLSHLQQIQFRGTPPRSGNAGQQQISKTHRRTEGIPKLSISYMSSWQSSSAPLGHQEASSAPVAQSERWSAPNIAPVFPEKSASPASPQFPSATSPFAFSSSPPSRSSQSPHAAPPSSPPAFPDSSPRAQPNSVWGAAMQQNHSARPQSPPSSHVWKSTSVPPPPPPATTRMNRNSWAKFN